jgi:replicative DNA helicase
VVDYFQLMSTGKKVESRQVEVSEFSRGLKVLARDLDVPVLALSQLNRSLESELTSGPCSRT